MLPAHPTEIGASDGSSEMSSSGNRSRPGERQALGVLRNLLADGPATSIDGESWTWLRGLAFAHGMSGFVASAISAGRLKAPDEVAWEIAEDWQRARRRVATIDLEIDRISRELEARSRLLSPPILFKGPAVAHRYQDPSLRSYVDIDLIVPAAELRDWLPFLEELGYRSTRPWKARDLARYQAGVSSQRSIGPHDVLCDVHWCVFIERTARKVTYERLEPESAPSSWPNVRGLSLPALLVTLALHYASHPRPTRRLIWLRDFVELGRSDVVTKARALAAEWGVGWAVELTLLETEEAMGKPIWGAQPVHLSRFGLPRAYQLEHPGVRAQIFRARELGLRGGLLYLIRRLDPRRFATNGRPDWSLIRAWASRLGRQLAEPFRRRSGRTR